MALAARQRPPLTVALRRTRRGFVRREVKEVYLRNDIPCGVVGCSACYPDGAVPRDGFGRAILDPRRAILILDAEVALTQLDLLSLDGAPVNNCVILGSVLETVRLKNPQAFTRLRALCTLSAAFSATQKSENDVGTENDDISEDNPEDGDLDVEAVKAGIDPIGSEDADEQMIPEGDRRRRWFVYANHFSAPTHTPRLPEESKQQLDERSVFVAVGWYRTHIAMHCCAAVQGKGVTLLVNDDAAKERAAMYGLTDTETISEYVARIAETHPSAVDKVVLTNDADQPERRAEQTTSSSRRARYTPHMKLSDIEAAVRGGSVLKGIIRMDRLSHRSGNVKVEESEIRVIGHRYINRAVDGDLVAVTLLSADEAAQFKGQDCGLFETEENSDEEELAVSEARGAPHLPSADNETPGVLRGRKTDLQRKKEKLEASRTPSRASTPRKRGSSSKKSKSGASHDAAATAMQPQLTRTKYGKVVGIIKRNWKEYPGSLLMNPGETSETASSFVKVERLFRPIDPRIPDIIIRTQQSSQLIGKRLTAVIDSWSADHRYPSGHWVDVIGSIDDPETESEVILKEYDVSTRGFSDAVLRCLPPASYVIPVEEIERRLDLRGDVVCSIDPPGCRDIDDALSCKTLPNGNYLAGVHIADVTHFVLPDTPLDLEAADRCTTVYLVEKRTDMLPGLLTTDLCSLVADQDRLTFSVLWELNEDAEIVSTNFRKAVIRSRKAFTYEEAQNLLQNKKDKSPLRTCIKQLAKLAKQLRERRLRKGALELASLEVRFELDSETHDPSDVAMYQTRQTNQLVEEFMLLANMSVAQKILRDLPLYSVLRRHPPPKEDALRTLQQQLASIDLDDFKFDTSVNLSESLRRIERPGDPFFNKLIKFLTTRCMNQAVYVCTGDTRAPQSHERGGGQNDEPSEISDSAMEGGADSIKFRHYGLAAALYTHFTSPIRRYADVLVHRLLAVSLGLYPLPDQLRSKAQMVAQCEQMNWKHRNAQWACRASVGYYTYKYFRSHGEEEADGIVIGLKSKGMQVLVPRYGIEGFVPIEAAVWNPVQLVLKWEQHPVEEFKGRRSQAASKRTEKDGGNTISVRLFDHVWIRIYADNSDLRPKTVMQFIEKSPVEKFVENEDYAKKQEAFVAEISGGLTKCF